MKGALKIFGGLVIFVAGYIWFTFYDVHVRYRLTVEVQDNGQIKTGSSVIEDVFVIQPDWSMIGPVNSVRVIGYAPTVDLGAKGLLVLTFAQVARTPDQRRARNKLVGCLVDDIGCLPFAAYGTTGVGGYFSQRKAVLAELLRQSGPRDVPFAVLPKLVRFREINDPKSLVAVAPDDLAASFGPGVELKRVILELTNDPLTPPPEIWPQWLKVKRQNTNFRGYEWSLACSFDLKAYC
jgi:hypothetical protein